jgi:hypothetical protein
MALPDTYSELYPGRFMKADALKGRKITLTIAEIDVQDLEGDTGKKAAKVIATFAKPHAEALAKLPLELVLPKTNGECLRRMFGNNPHAWVGKRVTLFPSTTKFGRETVDCIRIWGSPELAEDMPITVPQGRKKALEMVMHKVTPKTNAASTETAAAPPARPSRDGLDPRILAGLGLLSDADADEFLATHKSYSAKDMLLALNAKLDVQAD